MKKTCQTCRHYKRDWDCNSVKWCTIDCFKGMVHSCPITAKACSDYSPKYVDIRLLRAVAKGVEEIADQCVSGDARSMTDFLLVQSKVESLCARINRIMERIEK